MRPASGPSVIRDPATRPSFVTAPQDTDIFKALVPLRTNIHIRKFEQFKESFFFFFWWITESRLQRLACAPDNATYDENVQVLMSMLPYQLGITRTVYPHLCFHGWTGANFLKSTSVTTLSSIHMVFIQCKMEIKGIILMHVRVIWNTTEKPKLPVLNLGKFT